MDALLVPTEVVAHEVYAQISTPMLWRFIQQMPAQGDQWAAEVIQRLRYNCGHQLPALWKIKLDREQAPSLDGYLANGKVRLTDLVRSPEDRSRHLRVVPLLLLRGDDAVLTPDGETVLAPDDQLLFAGRARRDASSRPPWSSTRPPRTCCSTSTFRRAGSGASFPERTSRESTSDDWHTKVIGSRP